MTNRERFFACCKAIAYIDGCIDALEGIGLKIEPTHRNNHDNFADLLYGSCDDLIHVAMSYLDTKELKDSECIYQAIMTANPDTYFRVATEAWTLYGIEQDI